MSTKTATPKAKAATVSLLGDALPINKDCTFTNNSKQDVMVLRAYSDTSTTPPHELFQQTLTVLNDKTTGQGVIKAGATATITLDATHKDSSNNDVYTTSYEFIIVRADCLYPVKSASTLLRNSTDNTQKVYPGVTIADADYTNMQSAEAFLKNIYAYPSYDLAKNYATALQNAKNALTSTTDMTDYVGNFFKSTVSYQSVTQNMVDAMTTYYEQFPFIWASYQGSKTYYLYSTDNKEVKYAGSLKVAVSTANPASPDKNLSGFAFTFTDPDNNTKSLSYYKRQFVDVVTDVPGVCITGSFILKGELSNDKTDTDVVAVMVGNIGALKVIGIDEKETETTQTDPNTGDTSQKWSGTYDLLHADSVMKVIQLLLTIAGLIAFFKETFGGLRWAKNKIAEKLADKKAKGDDSPLNEDEFVEIGRDAQAYTDAVHPEVQEDLERIDPQGNVPDAAAAPQAMENASAEAYEVSNQRLRQGCQDLIDAQSDMLAEITTYYSDGTTDNASDAIQAAQDKLDRATTPEELTAVAPEIRTSLSANFETLKVAYRQALVESGGGENNPVEQAHDIAQEVQQDQEAIEEANENRANETQPEDAEFPFKDYEPDIFE